jgi:hypothetical protein
MPLDQLPEELLLQVAFHLPDSATPKHLKNLCLTSRKLCYIAQEALHTTAKLSISCGCHPKLNAVVKLLRTLLDRPDLASKVKTLRFRAVRKRVDILYAKQGFELEELRETCVSKLEELGYKSTHPWWRSVNNYIESSFGGLLLTILPNLTDLDFWIKDHQRGPPSSECISGLWGGTSPPQAIVHGWKNISHLVTGDTSVLKCNIQFDKLTSLDLRTISIGTVLRLNGPGSLLGAENLKDLALTVSIQFADRPLVEKAEVEFSELLEALNCRALRSLKILFINDGYHIGDDLTTELNAAYFLDQLCSLHETLESLSITLETTDDDGELEWLVDMCQHPSGSLRSFTALKSLVIPQPFLFTARSANWNTENVCHPKDLPPNLEQLELMYPREDVEEWVEGFLDNNYYSTLYDTSEQTSVSQGNSSRFKKLTLTCRDDVGIGAAYFTEGVDMIWWTLSEDVGIEAELHDQLRDTRHNLAGLYEDGGLGEEGSGDEDDEHDDKHAGERGDELGEDDRESDDSMPELEAYDPDIGYDARPVIGTPRTPFALITPTDVLRCLRDLPDPSQGLDYQEIAHRLGVGYGEATFAAYELVRDGHIRNGGNRVYFVSENTALREEGMD